MNIQNELNTLHSELLILLGSNKNGFIITNFQSNKQKDYFTLQLSKNFVRLTETSAQNKQDWHYQFNQHKLSLNGEKTSSEKLLELSEKFFKVVKYILAKKVTVFENDENTVEKNGYSQSSQLTKKEMQTIVGGVGSTSSLFKRQPFIKNQGVSSKKLEEMTDWFSKFSQTLVTVFKNEHALH